MSVPPGAPVTAFLVRLGEDDELRQDWQRDQDDAEVRILLNDNGVTDTAAQDALINARHSWDFAPVREIVIEEAPIHTDKVTYIGPVLQPPPPPT